MIDTVELPQRVRALILGAGIHGCAVAHDLATRGWRDVHIVERAPLNKIEADTAPIFIHDGLRYLHKLVEFGSIASELRERHLLMSLVAELIQPVEFLVPISIENVAQRLRAKASLLLYDIAGSRHQICKHKFVTLTELAAKADILARQLLAGAYSFWSCLVDEVQLVNRVAQSAVNLGAAVSELSEVERIDASADGWIVTIKSPDGHTSRVSALYVINCLGARANLILEGSGIAPTHRGLNLKTTQIVMPDLGIKSGLSLPLSKLDRRPLSVFPWQGHTMLVSPEDFYAGDPDHARSTEIEIDQLIAAFNQYTRVPLRREDIKRVQTCLKWSTVHGGSDLSSSRSSSLVGERASGRGLLLTVYGGQVVTYRELAREVADRICSHFGEFRPSGTHHKANWVAQNEACG